MMFFLKAILNPFAESTRLHANYQKSNIYPINMPAEKMIILAKTFKCNIGTLLFTYLGLPMGTTKPNLSSFIPLIQKIEKRLSSTSMFLSLVGRLQMVNSVFSSLPTYFLCTLIISKAIIAQIDKYKNITFRGGRHGRQKTTTGSLAVSVQPEITWWPRHR
jgi:hypothetical protein